MINLIIFSKFKLYILGLYIIFIEYTSWIILFLFKIILNVHINNTAYNSKLAFNFNIIYLYQNQNNYEQIKKIEFESMNHIIYKKLLHTYKSSLNPKKFKTIKIYIKQVIETLKSSGSIKHIKLTSIIINNKKLFALNISTNSLLKKIIVINYKQLIIPRSYLIKLFQYQIGLPQNYIQLNKSIHKIYLWYKKKGFNWINIKIIIDKKTENIYLKITEGKISENILMCMYKKKINKNIKYQIEQRIKKELNILPGAVFNTKKTELGINYLKEIELIVDCKYQIIRKQKGLQVTVKYYLFKDKITNFYNNNISLNKKIYIYSAQFLNHFSKYFYNKNNINVIKLWNNIFDKIFPLTIIKQSILINQNHKIISLNKYLAFKYSSFNYSNDEKKFISDIKIKNQIPTIETIISYPNITISHNSPGYLIVKLYYKLNKLNFLYPLQSKQILNRYSYTYSALLESKGLQALFKHLLYNNTYLSETINIINYRINKTPIYLNSLSQEFKHNYILKRQKYNLKILSKKIKQQLISMNISIKYNTFYVNDAIKSGVSLLLEIISCISLPFNKLGTISLTKYSYEYLYFQYYQSIIIPKIIKYMPTNKNAFILFLEFNLGIKSKHNLPFMKINSNQEQNLYGKSHMYEKYSKLDLPLYLSHVEYKISINNYISIYTFFNYTQSLSEKNYIKYHISTNLEKYEINLGYGMQFNIPVKKIPPLRVEHGINNKKEHFFQLRTYSQYN